MYIYIFGKDKIALTFVHNVSNINTDGAEGEYTTIVITAKY